VSVRNNLDSLRVMPSSGQLMLRSRWQAQTTHEAAMKDLIDYLGIYRARTLPKAPKQDGKAYYYAPSTKAAGELKRWPAHW
jgi:hypothetical protein